MQTYDSWDIRLVEGQNDETIKVEEHHTRQFNPEHKDGAPYSVFIEIDGWIPGRDGVAATVRLAPEQAVELGILLIEAGSNTLRMNRTEEHLK